MGACCGSAKGPESPKPSIKQVLSYSQADLADRKVAEAAYNVVEEWIHLNPNDRLRPKVEEKRKEIRHVLFTQNISSGIDPQVCSANLDSSG